MTVFSRDLSDLCLTPVSQKLHTVLVPAEVLLLSSMCAACRCRVDAGSAPLEVSFLIALVSTAAVSVGNSCYGDDGSSQGVLVAMAFEQVVYSDARW